MGEIPPHEPDDDDYDGLAALDFSYVDSYDGDQSADSGLDAFVAYDAAGESGEDELPVPLFTVTNPPGTVTVTAYLDGRVHQIELSPKVTRMTEADLADEILVIAELAGQEARSAQHAFMLEGMREYGHDDVATRDFLTRDLNLPTPEQADLARAQVFSTRYGGDHG
ncbi:YbaB/EbfC family DNA-binding protein [Mycobacterium sp. 21AC1]|uniref:YbaB/EbfC family DNA-binding protein n=1 Tax=[Mycobacterium] appelbergii TaxID=2939269 RepID=UPI0029390D8F|nr:YbaB/EbfC family DNA-binding protein [Mycobacterium sp. 21AC1]MDV3123327.1 YbaB/EbfC family DNA-binding protein [Mycobacterium sp. 21AC1]